MRTNDTLERDIAHARRSFPNPSSFHCRPVVLLANRLRYRFGFIEQGDGQDDLFVHRNDLQCDGLNVGDEVTSATARLDRYSMQGRVRSR